MTDDQLTGNPVDPLQQEEENSLDPLQEDGASLNPLQQEENSFDALGEDSLDPYSEDSMDFLADGESGFNLPI